MDERTAKAYLEKASAYSQDWLAQPVPQDMYDLIQKYFNPKVTTADIGCGNGRDANWLFQSGFIVTGYDSSEELLKLARKNFSKVKFEKAQLPELNEISEKYDNVLCETVIMHLPKSEIPTAIQSLKNIIKPHGVLYLSWRVTEGEDARHEDGRLYSAFDSDFILKNFSNGTVLHFEDAISASSQKRICRLIWKS
jgi:2-polyprenyl-3-methyl-5-hydroxy-6-metoxy-1,4-benzoquinol methylase